MAIFYPEYEVIKKLKQAPTIGELHVLNILQNLPDDFEIYFQPYINGSNPDIIIMRENHGVIIIEVKDWILDYYIIDNKKNWFLKKDKTPIKSPIEQVKRYKNDLYSISIPSLLEKKIKNPKYYGLVKNIVFFYNENFSFLNNFIKRDKFDHIQGKDSFNEKIIYELLKHENKLFTNELYHEFQRVLKPSFHTLEQAQKINLTPKQKALSKSEKRQQKIRGIAGAGKTVVLAQRAVNSHIRHNKSILILTYNITLRNYIHDNISRVRKNFDWKYFHILHYDAFIFAQANNYNIKDVDRNNIDLFESVKDKIQKYEAIFIDEIQDYQEEWIKIIKKYFLVENGEFVVFGDEKQNVYGKKLSNDKKPNTTIKGAWTKLDQSFRLSNNILELAEKFQAHFFTEKYELDKAIPKQQTFNFDEEIIEYYKFNEEETLQNLSDFILRTTKEKFINPQDICIIAHSNSLLRELDYEIRQNKLKTFTTFETKEIYDFIKSKDLAPTNFDNEIREIRRNKRFNFWMNAGGIKLSTVHSFKGWEIDTLFLIVDNKSKHTTDEIIYTALTRCRNKLFIINIDNPRYDDFFSKNITNKKSIKIQKETITQKPQKTIANVIEEELETDFYLKFHKIRNNKKFNILILGEISGKLEKYKEQLNSHFNKFGINAYQWDIDLWNNKTIKNKGIKSLRKGQSKYNLVITAQIHHHSSKNNKDQNLLMELVSGTQYIDSKFGCKPQNLLTINDFIMKVDEYINEVD